MNIIKIILVSGVIVFTGVYCKNIFFDSKEPGDRLSGGGVSDSQPFPGEKVKVFSITGYADSGKKSWELEAKSADILSEIINLFDINADSYGHGVKVNLKADKGIFNRSDNGIKLNENVRIVTDEGTKLFTESLDWDAKHELVSTQDTVTIERKEMTVTGRGAKALPNLSIVQLLNEVKVDLRQPKAVITCDGPLEVDYNKNIAYFYSNVKVIDEEALIKTDKATAYFEPKEKALKSVFCEGNVVIERGMDITYAKKLTYLPEQHRILLEGRPKIIIRDTEGLLKRFETKRELIGE